MGISPSLARQYIENCGLDPAEVLGGKREGEEGKPAGKLRGEPNKLEIRFKREYLDIFTEGNRHAKVFYEPLTFRLPGGVKYTPDWLLWQDGQPLKFYEVKPTWLSKNARDSRTRLKVTAGMYPWWEFYGAIPEPDAPGCWDIEYIKSKTLGD